MRPPPRTSMRLDIATKALDAVRDRLAELPDVPAVRALRKEAQSCNFELVACHEYASVDDRAAALERILELHVAVTRLARDLEAP